MLRASAFHAPARAAPQLGVCVRGRQLSRRATVAARSDASARVRGDIARVFIYVTDVERWPTWYPGLISATKTNGAGNAPATVGNRYTLEQKLAGFKVMTTYQVAQVDEKRRIVFSGKSKNHTVTDQLVFMPDPTDPGYTIVRYVTAMNAGDGLAAMALRPLVSGVVAKLPDEALVRLQKLLSSSPSPLAGIQVPKPDARTRSSSGTGSSRAAASAAVDGASVLGGLLGSFFSGFASAASSRPQSAASAAASAAYDVVSAASAAASAAYDVVNVLDPQRYYRTLGLDPTQRHKLEVSEVRASFRKLALTMHPDKSTGLGEKQRARMEVEFRLVQQAYEVLKDPERKAAYDSGRLIQEGSVGGR
ncbi:hypothetical protein FOA52_015012 [Chlamydomonas sp. UWO 241]|nr:hypothetical protein FOA52_015012 [Chlamydomonas sp. UWO 241]